MAEIETGVLTEILLDTRADRLEDYARDHLSALEPMSFGAYYQEVLTRHHITRAAAIANSGIEVHYAYQILSGLKNASRDKLLCLCIGGGLTIQETNRALARASAGCLYPKRLRDAIIMLALNKHLRTVWAANELLAAHREPLLE